MHRAIMFNGIWVSALAMLVFFLHGKQARRELDEQMNEENKTLSMDMSEVARSPQPQQ
jgi:hypothetical protein